MQSPECGSTNTSKNGKQKGKQNHICKECRRQFFDTFLRLLDTQMSLSVSASECPSMA
jgi:transposase-like protein